MSDIITRHGHNSIAFLLHSRTFKIWGRTSKLEITKSGETGFGANLDLHLTYPLKAQQINIKSTNGNTL